MKVSAMPLDIDLMIKRLKKAKEDGVKKVKLDDDIIKSGKGKRIITFGNAKKITGKSEIPIDLLIKNLEKAKKDGCKEVVLDEDKQLLHQNKDGKRIITFGNRINI